MRTLKLFLLLLLIMSAGAVNAQDESEEFERALKKANLDDLLVDVTPPATPAAHVLDVSSGDVKQPGNMKEMVLQLGSLVDKEGQVRGTGSIEFSPLPWLFPSLDPATIRLDEYRDQWKTRTLSNIRLSFATVQATETTSMEAAVGLSAMVYDRSEKAMDELYLIQIASALREARKIAVYDEDSDDDDQKPENEEQVKLYYQDLKEEIEKGYRLRTWNATQLQVAGVVTWDSRNDKLDGVEVKTVHNWVSFRFPVGPYREGEPRFGQAGMVSCSAEWVAGARDEIADSFIGGLRFTYGMLNDAYYVESAFTASEDLQPVWSLAVGYEVRIAPGIWYAFGVKHEFEELDSRTMLNLANLRWGHRESRFDNSLPSE